MARIALVADDSPTIQKRAQAILKGEGFEVETVSNGVAAIKRLAVLHPTVILADVSMPGRDGYEVCDFVKKSPDLAHVPVLLVASDMEPYDQARGARVKADGVIKKPFESHELISLVAKYTVPLASQIGKDSPTPIVSPEAGERTREFTAFRALSDDEVMLTHPEATDHTAQVGEVALNAPARGKAPEFFADSARDGEQVVVAASMPEPPALADSGFELPASFGEDYAAVGQPALPVNGATPTSSEFPPTASTSDGRGDSLPQTGFAVAEPPPSTQAPAPVGVRTLIFRTPLDIADAVWGDQRISPAPAQSTAPRPIAQPSADSDTTVLGAETLAEQPLDPQPATSVTATSLESFSLDEAVAGQVHFASHDVDIEFTDHNGAKADEETTAVGLAPMGRGPEAAEGKPTPREPTLSVARVVSAATEPAREEPEADTTPDQPARETIYAESVPFDSIPGQEELSAPEAILGMPHLDLTAAADGIEAKMSETATPPATAFPAFDWNLFYTIIYKTVVRMSPPVLPRDTIDEIARRLADEIAIEITSGASPSHT